MMANNKITTTLVISLRYPELMLTIHEYVSMVQIV
jgi:hypothetical protein